jgi:hypothetical protein
MKTRTLMAFASIAMFAAGCGAQSDAVDDEQSLNGAPEPAPPGAHGFLAREYAKSGGSSSSPILNYGGGPLLITNKALAIWWGDWSSPGDVITGMDSFFNGLNGSNFAATSDEYTDASGTHITTSTTFLGNVYDTSAAPKRAINTSTAVAEACKMANQAPDPNAIYFIFTSTGAGHVNYCAWHSWGACSNGAQIQVAYMPNNAGVAGCDPQDTWTTHSEELAALANVTSHEWSEARTDPRGTGYTAANGQENGDECAWSFHSAVTLANKTTWKLQMEWSNDAYNNGTGYPNLNGQAGCIQGN